MELNTVNTFEIEGQTRTSYLLGYLHNAEQAERVAAIFRGHYMVDSADVCNEAGNLSIVVYSSHEDAPTELASTLLVLLASEI